MKIVQTKDIYSEFLSVAANNKLSVEHLLDAADVCILSAAEILGQGTDRLSQDYATELIAGAYLSLVEARLAYKKTDKTHRKLTVVKGDKT